MVTRVLVCVVCGGVCVLVCVVCGGLLVLVHVVSGGVCLLCLYKLCTVSLPVCLSFS